MERQAKRCGISDSDRVRSNMEERKRIDIKRILRGTSVLIVLMVLACVVLVTVVLDRCLGGVVNDDLQIEPTPAVITSVMPRSELYVATAMVEDFVSQQATERHLGIFKEEHSCMLIMRQKVSYRVNLNEVEYEVTDLHHVRVRLPEVEYVASTVSTSFISDDEAYWARSMPSTTPMKQKVEQQIRSRFDTPENRSKALRSAQEAVAHILSQIGYEAEFVPQFISEEREIRGRGTK